MKSHNWLTGIGLAAYCGFIFYLSSLPGGSIGFLPFSDKVKHFFLYLILGSIFAYFLKNLKSNLTGIMVGTATLFFTLLYGLSDEIHQLFVPGRTFDLIDLLVDTIGGTFGGFSTLFFINLSKHQQLIDKNKEKNPQ